MTSSRIGTRLAAWAGLWAAGLLWALNMQLGQILPLLDCTRQAYISGFISASFAVLALLAAVLSWRSANIDQAGFGSPQTLRFGAGLSALAALIFTFALALQAIASWMLTGCEH